MSFTVEQAARFYGIDPVDYGRARPGGVIIGSGAGLMTALMDETPARWCVDMDDYLRADVINGRERLRNFAAMAHRARGIALAGWFSLTSPRVAEELVRYAGENSDASDVLVYARTVPPIKGLGAGREFATLTAFIEACRELWAPCEGCSPSACTECVRRSS